MKLKMLKLSAILVVATPVFAMAQTINTTSLLTIVNSVLRAVVPILMTLALIYFIWGLIKYVAAAGKGDAEESKHGKAIMIWGIVALFVMASVWGLVGILQNTFGLSGSEPAPTINLPQNNY